MAHGSAKRLDRFWLRMRKEPALDEVNHYRYWKRVRDLQIAEVIGRSTFCTPTKH
jgi:hypothetical protein